MLDWQHNRSLIVLLMVKVLRMLYYGLNRMVSIRDLIIHLKIVFQKHNNIRFKMLD